MVRHVQSSVLIVNSKENDLSGIVRDFKTYTSKTIISELKEGNDIRKEWILNYFVMQRKR